MNQLVRVFGVFAVALVPLALGCAQTKAGGAGAKPPTGAMSASPQATFDASPAAAGQQEGFTTANGVHVSEDIVRACNLSQPKEVAPHFAFDSAAIAPDDKDLLAAIARCLSEGPLQGRAVSLIGRADPRGENEYNMGLGESRADSVKRYLHDLGVSETRLGATSRGELDATGTDDQSWARDRRVDIELRKN